jgi:DNA-binding GntR family transcriptional regulator
MHSAEPQPVPTTTSAVVTEVFDHILDAVFRGELVPGQHISDAALAEQYGVSRTPVREALQRLREIGIVEASAGRFTRVAEVTPVQTAQSLIVWIALYGALVTEVVPTIPQEAVDLMEEDHAHFSDTIPLLDADAAAAANFAFFTRLQPYSSNSALLRAITTVIHVIRLGSLHLPRFIDLDFISRAQEVILEGVRARDVAKAWEGVTMLQRLEIPQE